jgi:DNA-directed RNA polymerase specialized sigma24 family protein
MGFMDHSRQSLLLRAQTGEEDAWKDLTDLYRPLIIGWLNRQGVPVADLDDLSQEILLSVVKHLPTFEHSGNRGAFRSWLRTIVCSRTTDYWRTTVTRTPASGGSGAAAALQQIADHPPAFRDLRRPRRRGWRLDSQTRDGNRDARCLQKSSCPLAHDLCQEQRE